LVRAGFLDLDILMSIILYLKPLEQGCDHGSYSRFLE